MVEYILLGVVQGITEFIPISSSAHIIIMEHLFGINLDKVVVTAVLHLSTALVMIVFFFDDIKALLRNFKMILLFLVITLITGAIGFFSRNFVELAFDDAKLVGYALLVTGGVLLLTRNYNRGTRKNLNLLDALLVGLTQGVAVFPGISRAGMTISSFLFRGINKEDSFRFSFLAAIPVIFGAALLKSKDIYLVARFNRAESLNLGVAFVASFVTGLFCLRILKIILLQKDKFYCLGYYCLFLAIFIFLFLK